MAKTIKRESKGFGGVKPPVSGNKLVFAQDIVDLAELDSSFQAVRFVGDVYGAVVYWIDIDTPTKGVISIPKGALAYNVETDSIDESVEDPYRDIPNEKREAKHYYANAIIRDIQDNEPKRKGKPSKAEVKSGFKQKGSEVWTPVRVVRLTSGLVQKLQKLRELNTHRVGDSKKKKPFDITDPKYGCDVFISFDKDAKSAGDMYQIQKGDASKLSKEEQEYLLWDVASIHNCEPLDVAIKEAKNLKDKCPDAIDEDEDEDDIPTKKKLKKKSSEKASSKKKKSSGDKDKKKVKKSDKSLAIKKKKKK